MSQPNLIIYTDGGARGNPGPAAIGYVIYYLHPDGSLKELVRKGETIGSTTNNQAEYLAVIQALQHASTFKSKSIEVRLDSELITRQLRGEYKIKNKELQPLFIQAKQIEHQLKKVSYTPIPRELNKEADKEVNRALDSEAVDKSQHLPP